MGAGVGAGVGVGVRVRVSAWVWVWVWVRVWVSVRVGVRGLRGDPIMLWLIEHIFALVANGHNRGAHLVSSE